MSRWLVSGLAILAIAQTVFSQRPEFEVASIKPNKSGGPAIRIGRPSPTRWESENTNLAFLIQYAWNMPRYRIIGGPDWIERDRFDIQAAMSAPVNDDETRRMLRGLLEDRFQLRFTQEKREQPVYILKQARRGVKIHPLAEGSCVTYDPKKPFVLEPGQPQPKWCGGTSFGPTQLKGTAIAISEFARLLEEVTHRPVVDETGLLGKFDIEIKWAPDERTPGFSDTQTPLPTESGPSLFTVLEEELGLSLDAGRAPVEVLLIQSAQQPTAN